MIAGASEWSVLLRHFFKKIKLSPSLSPWGVGLFLFLCFFPYAKTSADELLKFQDPFYRTPSMETVSRNAAALAQGKKIHWVGPMYAFHPKEFVFHPDDEVGYLYHFYNHTVRFYNGDFVFIIATDNKRIYQKDRGLFVREALRQIKDGDVLIINPNPKDYNTIDLPEKSLPLFVQKCRVFEFVPLSAEGSLQKFVSQSIPGFLQTGIREGLLRMEGSGLPDGTYEIYGRGKAGTEPVWIDTLSVKNGELPPIVFRDRNARAYSLLTYTPPIIFPQDEKRTQKN